MKKKKIEYVVEGACVKCSQGSQPTTLKATTNSRIGKQLRIVDTDTTNDKFVSGNGKPCVTMDSFLVCTVGGGAITPVDSGQILDDVPRINPNFNPNTGVGDIPATYRDSLGVIIINNTSIDTTDVDGIEYASIGKIIEALGGSYDDYGYGDGKYLYFDPMEAMRTNGQLIIDNYPANAFWE